MQLELRHLRYFLAGRRGVELQPPAERVHIAQPALSAAVPSFVQVTRAVVGEESGDAVAIQTGSH